MKPAHLLLLLALVTPALHAADEVDELQRLKDENAALKAQIESMKQQPPAAAASTAIAPTAGPAAAAATSTAGTTAPASAPAAPVAASNDSSSDAAAGRQMLNGVDLSLTGCSRKIFDYGPDYPWKKQASWDALHKDMTTREVEQWLGKAHYNIESKGRLLWQFGKCGDEVEAYAVFEDNNLLFWKAPDF